MDELISVKALTNDIERILRSLGVDTDESYRRTKTS